MHLTPTRTRTERQEGGDFAQKPSKFIGFLKHTFVILRLINLSYGAISKTKRAKISSQFMKECKPRTSKSRFQFAVSTLILILVYLNNTQNFLVYFWTKKIL